MYWKNKSAFTLVELIIVITIISILSTIAYVSFWSYTKNSRDTHRIYSLKEISKSLEVNKTITWNYPIPDNIFATGEILSTPVFQVGMVGEFVSNYLKFWSIPKDPVIQSEFTYWLSLDNKYYQVAGTLENQTSYKGLSSAYASQQYRAQVEWNYPWFLTFSTGWRFYIWNIPSLIFSRTWTYQEIWNFYVINKWLNLPYKLSSELINPPLEENEILQEMTQISTNTLQAIEVDTKTEEKIIEIANNIWIDPNIIWQTIIWKDFVYEEEFSPNPVAPIIATQPPEIPTWLNVINTSHNAVQIQWNSSSWAEFYNIYLNENKIATSITNTYTITSLLANTNYNLKISAENNHSEWAQSNQITFLTAPAPPTIVHAGSNESMIGISWSAVPWAASYMILNNGTPVWFTPGTWWTLTWLDSNTIYSLTVHSMNNQNSVSWPSNQLNVSTAPKLVTNFRATHVSNDSISLAWDHSPWATWYALFRNSVPILSVSENFAHIEWHSTNTNYNYTIRPFSWPTQVTNPIPAINILTAPTTLWSLTNVVVSNITSTSMNITWDIMPSASKYYVYVGGKFDAESSNNNENILTLTDLPPNTQIPIRVVAVTWNGSFWNGVASFGIKWAQNVQTNP